MMRRRWLLSMILLTSLMGCGTTSPVPTAPPPTLAARTATPVPATDEEAILQLLHAEGEAVVQQDIDRLMDIWAEDGIVVDARHTPQDASDDLTWRGRDAIYQRYVTVVFPGNPQVAGAVAPQIIIDSDSAEAISTTHIGSEIAPAGDRWTFVRREGRWHIATLTYNLEE